VVGDARDVDRDRAAGRRVLDRVVQQVGDRLRDHVAVAHHGERRPDRDVAGEPALLRERPVELRHVGDRRGDVELGERLAPRARIDLGDAQQRLEHRHHRVDLGDRLLHVVEALARQPGRVGDLLEPAAHPRQRRAQVVRDRVRDLAHAVHQAGDLVEHDVDGLGQQVELVARARDRHAMRHVALDDGEPGAADRFDLAQQHAAEQQAAEDREQAGHRRSTDQRVDDEQPQRAAILDVAADDQPRPVGEAHDGEARDHARLLGRELALAPGALVELRLGGHDVAAGRTRPRREIAGEAATRRVGEQEQPLVLGVVAQPLLDRGDRAGDAVGAHAVGHGVDVGLDRRIDLAVEVADGRPVGEQDHQQGRTEEQPGVDHRQAQRGRAQDPRGLHAARIPRCAPCAAAAWRSPCRSSGAAG
jgi:hypothetical protein